MGRSTPLHFLLFVHLLRFRTFALNNGTTIALGSTLIASDGAKPWLSSPSGDFAFGFSQLKGTNQFLLGIWYANINDRTIVWNANTDSPVPPGSKLQLSVDGLILLDPESNNTLWRTDEAFVGKIKQGILYDTGKFAISGSGSAVLWDTFSHPTHTLLPTQSLEIGTVLISPRSEANNLTPGRFYLQLLDSGNLVLSTKSVPTNSDYDAEYYNNQTGSGYKVIFTEKGSISVLKRDNTTVDLVSLSSSIVLENHLRLTLNFDGVLALYRYPKVSSGGTRSWIPLWTQPDNICIRITGSKGSGACGYNNVCSLDTNGRPSCKCPPGYSLIDPSDKYGSCKPNSVPTCDERGSSNNSSSYGRLIEVRDTDWPLSDFEQISPSSKEGCRRACLVDCFCSVAIYRSNSCWKKKLPLSNGRIDTSLGATAFLKVGEGDVPPSSSKHG